MDQTTTGTGREAMLCDMLCLRTSREISLGHVPAVVTVNQIHLVSPPETPPEIDCASPQCYPGLTETLSWRREVAEPLWRTLLPETSKCFALSYDYTHTHRLFYEVNGTLPKVRGLS